ncbi:MAG: hypothetical protein L6Q78_06890 [Bacteroidia bacterium]|nr:hypothetical protein [Bacteroidia bacterium]
MERKIRESENLHVILWLVKDTFWMLEFKPIAVFMIAPTLAMALWVLWISRNEELTLLPNLAVTFWILANGIWMLDEFYFTGTKLWSLIPFISGIAIMLVYLFMRIKAFFNKKA